MLLRAGAARGGIGPPGKAIRRFFATLPGRPSSKLFVTFEYIHACMYYMYIMERPECNRRNRTPWLYWVAVLWGATALLAGSVAWTQTAAPGLISLPSAEQVINRAQDPFAGSLPQGQPTGETLELSVEEALDRGLKYNLGLYLSDRATEQSRAAHLKALSDLLPHIAGSLSEQEEKLNLKALGFTSALIPGIPTSIGPFSVFTLQATGSWDAIDLSGIDNVRAADQNLKAAQFSYRDARDTVVLAVGANYLLTIANESRVTAAQAELQTAQALFQLASDQETAGLAPNIDTLRARVQLQTQQSVLIQAQNDLEKQRIALARVIGLPVTQKFRLVNRVPYHALPEMELQAAYGQALATRPDYQAALSLLRSAQLKKESAWKERVPTIGFSGDYGVLGNQPSSISPNWTAAASLNIPIFEGGKIRSDEQSAEAILKQRQAQVDSLKAGIEQDIENALLDIRAASQQVDVAKIGLGFAQQTLAESQDRFSAGVTNNVEVIQAQQQLASANDQYIASLYAHNIAKVLLARAIGNAEQAVKQYLSEPASTLPANTPPSATPQQPGSPQPADATPQGPSGATMLNSPAILRPRANSIASTLGPTLMPAGTGANNPPATTVPDQ